MRFRKELDIALLLLLLLLSVTPLTSKSISIQVSGKPSAYNQPTVGVGVFKMGLISNSSL